VVTRRTHEGESSGLDSTNRAPRGEAGRFPRRCSSERVRVEPDLVEYRVNGVDVRAIVNPLDLQSFGRLSMDEAWEAVEKSLEPVRTLRVSVMTG
jgi:hypothetical protein